MTSDTVKPETVELDDIPFNKFHFRIAALTFGAHWNDGFVIGMIGVALTLITPAMNLSQVWQGAIGAAVLIGLTIGSLVSGMIADKFGRQRIFAWSFVLITVATFAQFWVSDPLSLFTLRVLIGIGIGGDYAVGHTLLAEILPRKRRGEIMGSFSVIWTFGYVLATVIAVGLLNTDIADSWRWMLISPGIVALAILVLRMGTPESPRWLMRQGRVDEANAILKKHFGDNVVLESETTQEEPGRFSELFSKQYIRRTIFNGVFWAAIVMPYFAIYTFLPTILEAMGLSSLSEQGSGFLVEILLNIVLFAGALLGIYLTHKLSRRGFLISHLFILSGLLLILAIAPASMTVLTVGAMAIFTLLLSAVSNLVGVFPAESFPTRLRSAGVGLATAFSRLGSAASTFLLPILLTNLGLSATMAILAAILAIGGVVSVMWAPETKGKILNDAAH